MYLGALPVIFYSKINNNKKLLYILCCHYSRSYTCVPQTLTMHNSQVHCSQIVQYRYDKHDIYGTKVLNYVTISVQSTPSLPKVWKSCLLFLFD